MRFILLALIRLILRLFFRRIDVFGRDDVPATGPLIYVVNHPSALMDPMILQALSPRRVSFLAKRPLFDMFFIGRVVRAFESLPVYRQEDAGSNVRQNLETFDAAYKLLQGGGALAMFPEGVSHSEPRLLPLKTGAARIALGVSARASGSGPRPRVVPVGLYYTDKKTFRSAVLVQFGTPIEVPPVQPEADGAMPAQAVRELTERFATALTSITVVAPDHEALALINRAADVLQGEGVVPPNLIARLRLERRLVAAYMQLASSHPEALARLIDKLRTYSAPGGTPAAGPRHRPPAWLYLAALAVPGCLGVALHYPAYKIVGLIARWQAGNDDDMFSTVKVIAGLVLFPVTWVLLAVGAGVAWGAWLAAIILLVAPVLAVCGLWFVEGVEGQLAARRERRLAAELAAHRSALRQDIMALAELL